MAVTVRLFAVLRERAGVASVVVSRAATAGEAVAAAAERLGIIELLRDLPVAIAVNRTYADAATALADGDEVAVIPPVSGGAPQRISVELSDAELSLDRLVGLVRDPSAGAIVTFQGEPRDVDALEFEAFPEMALERMRAILGEVVDEFGAIAAAVAHRVGVVPAGSSCVIVAVSAGHRPAAFDAARAAIDRIKLDVPIWKREVDGARRDWVRPAGM